MPSQNMLPKGQRRRSVRSEYIAQRTREQDGEPEPEDVPAVPVPLAELEELEDDVRAFTADAAASGLRLDQYLAQALPDVSRARVQLLIEAGQVRVDGAVPKGKLKLRGGERIEVEGEPRPAPLHATPEDIPLDVLFEDAYLVVVNKPAGMMVHAGAGATEELRSGGTLVNALLFHLAGTGLSEVGGILRPGIVHRLDKQTSGAIVAAKDDGTHRLLGAMFAAREVSKTYVALAHGHLAKDTTTVTLPIARDLVRRTRMTTRRMEGRSAVSHFTVLERLATPWGKFTLLEARIETGRTHQIRVHLQALGHPVVGDTLYGAPHVLRRADATDTLALERNFLHARELAFTHPRTGEEVVAEAPLAPELAEFLRQLKAE